MTRTVATVSKAIVEQATATAEITRAAESMKVEADQAAKALKEQSRAMKDMTTAVASTTREIKLISHANREHSTVAGTLLGEVGEIRKITDRNARGVKETRVEYRGPAPAYRSAQRDRGQGRGTSEHERRRSQGTRPLTTSSEPPAEPLPIGVLTVDASLTVRTWSEWLESATGIPAAAACGRALADVVPDAGARGLLDRFTRVLESGQAQVLAPAFHHYLIPCAPRTPSPNFERMQQLVTLGALREGDRVVGVMATIEDVTRAARRRARARRRPAERRPRGARAAPPSACRPSTRCTRRRRSPTRSATTAGRSGAPRSRGCPGTPRAICSPRSSRRCATSITTSTSSAARSSCCR